jgi:ATP-dependent helicase HepA
VIGLLRTVGGWTATEGGGKVGGKFIYSTDNDLGIGKAIAADGDLVTVEYFCSVADGDIFTESIPRNNLRRVRLDLQTRCRLMVDGEWRVGRVVWNGDEEGSRNYGVKLPNSRAAQMVSEGDLYVRARCPDEDISEVVAALGTETPFFHIRRRAFMASVIRQRSAAYGMTGLLSSAVHLFEHQVEVVRRVLSDPVQRYLLADEVGLGKTIEAGVLIRQHLLDHPAASVMVISPPFLRRQWVKELQQKFLVDDFTEAKVRVLSSNDPASWDLYNDVDLVVIDEVHHLAKADDTLFSVVQRLCERTRKLFLLSATPILNNEKDFLRMLHLLNPDVYRLEDLEGFRERVKARQTLSSLFYQLREDAPYFILKGVCEALRDLFSDDARLIGHLDRLEAAIGDGEDSVVRSRVHEARFYVSEVFRVHRRLLRTRRGGRLAESFPLRGRQAPRVERDSTQGRDGLLAGVEEWRLLLFAGGQPQSDAMQDYFADVIESTFSDIASIRSAIEGRVTRGRAASSKLPFVDGEEELLEDLLRQSFDVDDERMDFIESLLADEMSRKRKIVVFASLEQTAHRVFQRLAKGFGKERVCSHLVFMDPAHAEAEVEKFMTGALSGVLVSDASGEEGRNFQFADLLVHYDLNFSPNRLEQRIGRLDRYSAGGPFDSVVVLDDPGSLSRCWYDTLSEGFGLFSQSIASLQFEIDKVMGEMLRTTTLRGVDGMSELANLLPDRLSLARTQLAEQDALDSIEEPLEGATLFGNLDELEDEWFGLQKAAVSWAGDDDGGLRFSVVPNSQANHVMGFHLLKPGKGMDVNTMPLIDWSVLKNQFAGLTSSPEKPRWGSFSRRVASDNSLVRLFRVGEPFIDALIDLTADDDRGRAFLMHRLVQDGDSLDGRSVFLFDFVIEVDISFMKNVLRAVPEADESVARRWGDRFFPPLQLSVWLDTQGKEITDERELRTLESPYQKPRDLNVSPERRHLLETQVGVSEWVKLCRESRAASERIARRRATLTERCADALNHASTVLGDSIELRQGRSRSLPRELRETEIEDLAREQALLDALIAGIRAPRILLDAMGLVMLGSQRP